MTDRPDLHTLTGAYAVDALEGEERERFESHLEVCEACAREVDELQATAARLAGTSTEPPPPALRAHVLAEIDTVRQERPLPSVEDAEDAAPARLPGWVTGALAAAAAILVVAVAGLAVVVLDLQERLAEVETVAAGADAAEDRAAALEARLVEVEALAASAERTTSEVVDVLAAPDAFTVQVSEGGMVGHVVASPSRGEAVFVADGFDDAPPAHTYELWLIHEDRAVPAGLFSPDERGRVTRVMTGDVASALAVGVTVEPDGGSPEPTTEPMLVVELS